MDVVFYGFRFTFGNERARRSFTLVVRPGKGVVMGVASTQRHVVKYITSISR